MNRNYLDSLYGKLLSADNTIERLEKNKDWPEGEVGDRLYHVNAAKIDCTKIQREIISDLVDLYIQTHS
jgi:hypothetical protein